MSLRYPLVANRSLIRSEISKSRVVEKTQGKRVRIREFDLYRLQRSELVSSKKSVVKVNINSTNHKKSVDKVAKETLRGRTIHESLRRRKDGHHYGGNGTYGVRVIEMFLSSAIPIRKILSVQPLEESKHHRLTSSGHVAIYIPAKF